MKEYTAGNVIDRMLELRLLRSELSKQDKALKAEFDSLSEELIAILDSQDTIQGKTKKAVATITEEEVANVEDWDVVFNYIIENNATYLLQRRLNNAAWRESLQMDNAPIPGTTVFKKRSISLKTN